MKQLVAVLAVLGFVAPAFADQQQTTATAQAAVLTDAQLDQVTAGGDRCRKAKHHNAASKYGKGHHNKGPAFAKAPVTNNIVISPIIVTQTAVAFSTQNATANGNKNTLTQTATNVAANVANINYQVKF